MRKFDGEDDDYLAWVENHQGGFVVNSYRIPKKSYLILHRATCKHISRTAPERIRWTSGDYIKICSTSVSDLEQWARDNADESLSHCGQCHPV